MSDKKEHREFCKRIKKGGGQVSEDESTNFIPSMIITNQIYDHAFGRPTKPDDRTEEEIRKDIKDTFIKLYGKDNDSLDRLTGQYTKEELDFLKKFSQCSEPPEEEEHPELRFTPSMRDAEKIYRNSGLPGIPAFDIWFSEEEEK